ncbi:MAG: glycosyltransferase [Parafilimonas sp.]|nr:glycosyltransferase [Parafilimonas sp.]
MGKPLVVISGVNLVEAGPLSVFKDAVKSFTENFANKYQLVLLVYNKNLLSDLNMEGVQLLEYKYPKKLWLFRVWFEYVHCYFLSKKLTPFFWFAIHDMTPCVACKSKAVYCHNPAPFYNLSLRDVFFEKSLFFFRYFYSFFYRLNIKTNKYVIVQQDWLRKAFEKKYQVANVIVAYPDVHINAAQIIADEVAQVKRFIYAAMPRVFKNYEVLLKAAEKLYQKKLVFEVIVTINGSENKYSAYLKKQFQHIPNIKFIGLQPRQKIFELYQNSSCLIFPSKLETWGLPITEMKSFHKPIFVANELYAHETVADYDKAVFFNANNSDELAGLMEQLITDTIIFHKTNFTQPAQPFTKSWKELFNLLLAEN